CAALVGVHQVEVEKLGGRRCREATVTDGAEQIEAGIDRQLGFGGRHSAAPSMATGTASSAGAVPAAGRRWNEEMAAEPSAAMAHMTHARSKWARASSRLAGCPSTATRTAMPTTAPSWREVWLMAPPTPKRSTGSPATAA